MMLRVAFVNETGPVVRKPKPSAKQQLHEDAVAALANWRIKELPKAKAMFAKEHAELDELERSLLK